MNTTRENIRKSLRSLARMEGQNVAFARRIGETKQKVGNWLSGRNLPDIETLANVARIYGVSMTDIFNGVEFDVKSYDSVCTNIATPIFGRIAAGKPIEMMEIDRRFPVPETVLKQHRNAFLLMVEGESMNRRLPNGCLVLIDPDERDVIDGYPYAVTLNRRDITVKRVSRLANGIELSPDSWDTTFCVMRYNLGKENDEVKIIGRVVWATMPFDYRI